MYFVEYSTESEKQKGGLGTGWLSVYQLFTLVVARLSGSCGYLPSQCHKRLSECIPLAWENKIQKRKIKVRCLLNVYSHTIVKSKNHKSNHRKLGTVCVICDALFSDNESGITEKPRPPKNS